MENITFDLSLVKEEPLDESFVFSQCYTANFLRYPLTLKTEPELLRDCTTIQDMFEYKINEFSYLKTSEFKVEAELTARASRNNSFEMTDVLGPLDNVPQRRKRSSDGKKVNSGSPYTSVPLPPCKVCGGVATGYHFGVITCEACKVC